jgi:GNAT superfamily N-acetyltransferase
MDIKIFEYNNASEVELCLLNDLIRRVWAGEGMEAIHPRVMNATSFCAIENSRFVGYVGVVDWDICVQTVTFKMCGLSCVCTHPEYRKQGIGLSLVRNATEWIVGSHKFDVGLFTCSHGLVPFYEKVGLWKRSPGLVLKENERELAFRSDMMELNVFKLLLSNKAKLHANVFEQGMIVLNFPDGKFI